MTPPYQGGCLCGAVRYTCTARPIHTFFCHCRDCQRETGGPFAAEIYVPATAVGINGPLKQYTRVGDSGMQVHRYFCIECGSVVLTSFDVDPTHVCLKACSLDEPSWLQFGFHLYVSSKQPWDRIEDGLTHFSKDF